MEKTILLFIFGILFKGSCNATLSPDMSCLQTKLGDEHVACYITCNCSTNKLKRSAFGIYLNGTYKENLHSFISVGESWMVSEIALSNKENNNITCLDFLDESFAIQQFWTCEDVRTISPHTEPQNYTFDLKSLSLMFDGTGFLSSLVGDIYLADRLNFLCLNRYHGRFIYTTQNENHSLFECHGNYSQMFSQDLTTNSGNLETVPSYKAGRNVTYFLCTTDNLKDAVLGRNCDFTTLIFYLNRPRDTLIGRAERVYSSMLEGGEGDDTLVVNETNITGLVDHSTTTRLKMGCTFDPWRDRCILSCSCAYNYLTGEELNWSTSPDKELSYWDFSLGGGTALASNSYVLDLDE